MTTTAPAHPGHVLRTRYLDPHAITLTAAAAAMQVTRKHVSGIVNGRASITPDMALRLAGAFGTTAEYWITLQAQYDLWLASRSSKLKVKILIEPRAA